MTPALALIGSVLFLAGAIRSDTRNSVYALVLLAVSYPVFRLINALKKEIKQKIKIESELGITTRQPSLSTSSVLIVDSTLKQLAILCADLFLVIINQSNDTWTSATQRNSEQPRHSRQCEGLGEPGHK